uniref:Uncharacterized protein n=1 Tax=Anguilla anguilla TaxID=7936 RepID=A0A0E9TWW1_ANGAN
MPYTAVYDSIAHPHRENVRYNEMIMKIRK